MLTDALEQARTEHVIFFLLTAYAESLGWHDPLRSGIPEQVTRLPIQSRTDVVERLYTLCRAREGLRERSEIRPAIAEAVDVFNTASLRLKSLRRDAENNG